MDMDDKKVENLIESYRKYAQDNGFKLNPDENTVKTLIKGFLANEEKYGYRYCPCRKPIGNKEEDVKKICPCVWHKEEIKKYGSCLCGLFVFDPEKESAEELLEREKQKRERDLQRMEQNDPFN